MLVEQIKSIFATKLFCAYRYTICSVPRLGSTHISVHKIMVDTKEGSMGPGFLLYLQVLAVPPSHPKTC